MIIDIKFWAILGQYLCFVPPFPVKRAQKSQAGDNEPPALASIYRFALAKSTCNPVRFVKYVFQINAKTGHSELLTVSGWVAKCSVMRPESSITVDF